MKVYISTNNVLLADSIKTADNFVTRTIGLILRSGLKSGQGLLIKPCCSIHTFFMRFSIDVVFINKNNEAIAIYNDVKPFKILPIHLTASMVLELPSGEAQKYGIKKGSSLIFEN